MPCVILHCAESAVAKRANRITCPDLQTRFYESEVSDGPYTQDRISGHALGHGRQVYVL